VKWELALLLMLWIATAFAAKSALAENPRLAFYGARVLPSGLVVAFGSATSGSATSPLIVVADSQGRVVSSFYLEVGGRGAFLDSLLVDDSLVAVGYVDSVVGRRAVLAAGVRGGAVEWATALGSGFVDFAKSVAPFDSGYALAGVTQPPEAGDSDALLVVVDGSGGLRGAYAVGSYMYNDFAERCYATGSTLILVGSTWSHNVSFSDVFLADVQGGSFATLGGADRDDGYAAAAVGNGVVVAGSTLSSPGGFSDAFYAVVQGGSFRVFSIGWPSYDGFADVYWTGGKLFMVGYSVREGKELGLLVRAGEDGFEAGVMVECEGDLSPLTLGVWNEEVVAVFAYSGSLLVVAFDGNLKPLRAFAIGYSASPTVKVLQVESVKQRSYVLTGSWSLKRQSLPIKQVELQSQPLAAKLVPLDIPSQKASVETGVLEEREPISKILIRLIESNIPLLMIAVPLSAIIIAVVLKRRS
jgi:hypothetical protein